EDGIRYRNVTGVQTCALPIFVMLLLRMRTGSHLYGTNHAGSDEDFCEVYDRLPGKRQAAQTIDGDQDTTRLGLGELMRQADKGEIGRASCRERGERAVRGGVS